MSRCGGGLAGGDAGAKREGLGRGEGRNPGPEGGERGGLDAAAAGDKVPPRDRAGGEPEARSLQARWGNGCGTPPGWVKGRTMVMGFERVTGLRRVELGRVELGRMGLRRVGLRRANAKQPRRAEGQPRDKRKESLLAQW